MSKMTKSKSTNLVLERGRVWSTEDLKSKSIYLDGAFRGPLVDPEKEIYSFDHHENCIRFATKSTCEQVRDALLLGMDPQGFTIYINDVDGDTVLSYWLIKNPNRVQDKKVRELVEAVGTLDSHGPAYPVGNLAEQFHLNVMEKVTLSKRNKTYATDSLEDLLQDCMQRLDSFIENFEMKERPQESRSYEILFQGNGYIVAKSDSFIFDLLYKDGFTKAIACNEQKDGSWAYTIGKKSEFVGGFPIPKILETLNLSYEAGWGGGTTIGGAPRNADGSRSRLSPTQIVEIIDAVLESI